MNALEIVKLVVAMRPRPAHVTIKQAAEMLDKSEPTIRKLIRDGKIKLNDAGMIPITEIDRFALPTAA